MFDVDFGSFDVDGRKPTQWVAVAPAAQDREALKLSRCDPTNRGCRMPTGAMVRVICNMRSRRQIMLYRYVLLCRKSENETTEKRQAAGGVLTRGATCTPVPA
jgi:hypothetical protein